MEVFEMLKGYLSTMTAIPPLQWLHLAKSLGIKRLKKNEVYFNQGQSFDEIGFVVRGLMSNTYIDGKGQEWVKNFVFEGNPVTCYSDLIRGSSAAFTSKALEPTILVTLKYKDLKRLFESHICWERIGRISAEKLYIEKEQREWDFLMLDAKSRYEKFLTENEGRASRIPQFLIAAYIGISPVSLSRLKNP